jgi:RNA polymerase sigma-70 factor (ECF subfamily)
MDTVQPDSLDAPAALAAVRFAAPAPPDSGHRPAALPTDGPEDTDAALLRAFATGDAQAFAALYARHERPLYRFVLRSLADAALADDLAQDTWLAVVRHAEHWTPRARFSTWLFGIARNKLIDHWRGCHGTVHFADLGGCDDTSDDGRDDDPGARWLERLAADAAGQPERQAQSRAQARALVRAVEQLPAAQRETFLLHAEGGLTIDEIAELTGCGSETIKSRFRYATGRLRSVLQDWR